MTLPRLEYKLTTQNQRVPSFGIADRNEDAPYIYRLETGSTTDEVEALIWAAYRQIFNEQETLRFNRQIALETQLKNRSISVRNFIRGLAKSERFYRLVVGPNSNYRLVEVCLKRLLGRSPYNQEEEMAWSIQIAQLGWHKFVDQLLDSDEYTQSFGEDAVPYQRKRLGDRPFSFTTRYGADYRDKLPTPKGYDPFEQFDWDTFMRRIDWPTVSGLIIATIAISGLFLLLMTAVNSTAG